MLLAELRRRLLGGYLTRCPHSETSVTRTTFASALSSLKRTHLISTSDEETTTGAFLGALTAVYGPCVLAYPH